MTHDVVSSVIDYRPYDPDNPWGGVYDARGILENEDDNGILGEVIMSYGALTNEVLAASRPDTRAGARGFALTWRWRAVPVPRSKGIACGWVYRVDSESGGKSDADDASGEKDSEVNFKYHDSESINFAGDK